MPAFSDGVAIVADALEGRRCDAARFELFRASFQPSASTAF